MSQLLSGILIILLVVGGSSAQLGDREKLSNAEMLTFLVQCIGLTIAASAPPLPVGPGGSCNSGADVTELLEWRKHDWPDQRDPAVQLRGHQASESIILSGYEFPVVVQTFDFGDAGRTFGTLDDNMRGDGGDAVGLLRGAAWLFFTEDAGNGQQWFVAEACRGASRADAPRESWLLFDQDVPRGRWREQLARLKITRSPDECPASFSNAYTRYTRDTLDVPYRVVSHDRQVDAGKWRIDSIVSEHFGGRSVEAANHLERFYFGRHLGKYRWERWEALALSKEPHNEQRAESLAKSERCAKLPYSEPPSPGWVMVDCRMWTNLVQQPRPWRYSQFGWPGAAIDAMRSSRQ
jgi:hypothetical protein